MVDHHQDMLVVEATVVNRLSHAHQSAEHDYQFLKILN